MSSTCPFCGSETGGQDPCPKCGGALGLVVDPVQARFVDRPASVDWRPWALSLLGLLVLGALVMSRHQPKPSDLTQKPTAKYSAVRGKGVGASPLLDLPPRSDEPSDEAPAPVALKTTKAPETPAPTSSDSTDTANETAIPPTTDNPTTVDQQSDLVKIGNVSVDTEQDDSGNSFAVGHLTVVNTSPVEISTFSITMDTGDGVFTLVPFEGTIDAPVTITDRRIPPGGYLDVPVMTEGIFQTSNAHGQKIITLNATENGLIATDRLTIQ